MRAVRSGVQRLRTEGVAVSQVLAKCAVGVGNRDKALSVVGHALELVDARGHDGAVLHERYGVSERLAAVRCKVGAAERCAFEVALAFGNETVVQCDGCNGVQIAGGVHEGATCHGVNAVEVAGGLAGNEGLNSGNGLRPSLRGVAVIGHESRVNVVIVSLGAQRHALGEVAGHAGGVGNRLDALSVGAKELVLVDIRGNDGACLVKSHNNLGERLVAMGGGVAAVQEDLGASGSGLIGQRCAGSEGAGSGGACDGGQTLDKVPTSDGLHDVPFQIAFCVVPATGCAGVPGDVRLSCACGVA